jgi:phage shock protein PspC (stress-responsive transcriptional regulator)
MVAGICAGLAEDLDLPLPLVRMVALLFLILPTGLAYLALTMLLRRRQPRSMSWSTGGAGVSQRQEPSRNRPQSAGGRPVPANETWALLRHRFEMLEPRVERIEAFVSAPDFELHRGFRRMGE